MKNNKFQYQVDNGSCKGFFNIYQARNGKIYLQLGNSVTPLSSDQVENLKIDVYELTEFDYDEYKKAYQI